MLMALANEETVSCPVDLEMMCISLVVHGVRVISEFKTYAIDVVKSLSRRRPRTKAIQKTLSNESSHLWRWLQQRFLRKSDASGTKQKLLPPLQPFEFQHIIEGFADIKTQLQLMHAILDDLQHKGEQADKNFCRLLRDISTCRYEARDRCTCSQISNVALSPGSAHNNEVVHSGDRPCGKTLRLQMDRLEVPIMDVARSPTAVQEQSSALLSQIVEFVGSELHDRVRSAEIINLGMTSK